MDEKDWIKLNPESPSNSVLKLLEFLWRNIRGQNDAVKDLADAIEVYEAGLRSKDKPIYTALLLGPSGVGKTLTAEILAEYWFGNRRAFTKIPCEEYSQEHAIYSLIGAPPSYVGYWDPKCGHSSGTPPILWQGNIDKYARESSEEEKKFDERFSKLFLEFQEVEEQIFILLEEEFAEIKKKIRPIEETCRILGNLMGKRKQLTQALDNLYLRKQIFSKSPIFKCKSIILFDEIEKANATLHNILLNIMDKAEIQLSNGMVTKLNNSVILMTSNVGSKAIAKLISKKSKKMGFELRMVEDAKKDSQLLDDKIYRDSMDAAKEFFRPEFIARFDRISVFRPLSRETMRSILDVEIGNFQNLLNSNFPVLLAIDDDVKEFIIDEATDNPENGARLLKQKLHKYLYKQICRFKNKKELEKGDILRLSLENGEKKKIIFKRERRELPQEPS